ncbi:bifunctional DNA-formamidopyrimidine glycosylase/DNA-(apurinic or apyrimidinic site) lyase [Tessaracoccus caeni]|uniref:bifunctional DNA-formamidopyrimidine glycosylase/DNA-(apurinic or apyrimidinic site) lyase n=1 Tax=Tessaracoccus caeni TaxID=3031239 RepID=UPI0023DC3D05|nr:bifunctional DNA-formamidopyrimidine glycosylase/DNA-(apurinic or apyrimidinic site) lyase [Tessaracoccus caeni]MDF1489778.1 bifunctional DNA-formamidopyrimidine glycosylase/DNA-(apurinic or apyrimidinic site) lyase [Tessaracoccus caeni]
MPELPEVEVVRRGLTTHLVGRRVVGTEVLHPRPVRTHPGGPAGFVHDVSGRGVDEVRRRGKYLWLVLGDDAVIVHLGMSGQFRVNQPGDELVPNTRVLFRLDDGTELRFVDQRMFGGLEWRPGEAICPVPHIALDPFDPAFDARAAAQRLRARRTTVKRALLDQGLVSGIGNIYADETLWRTRLHYDTPTATLGPRKAVTLLRTAGEVMAEALDQGGTSFDSLYVHVNGESGYFARSLDAYGREGLPCNRCATPIVRRSFMNRSSYLCPRCQRVQEPRGF